MTSFLMFIAFIVCYVVVAAIKEEWQESRKSKKAQIRR
jgi:hypothetical protein